MCLAVPGEVTAIDGLEARVEFWDVEKTVRLDIVGDTVEVGDYVLNHAGFAIRRIPDDQVKATVKTYEAFLRGDEDEALEELGAEDTDLGLAAPAGEAQTHAAMSREASDAAAEPDADAEPDTDADAETDVVRDTNGDAAAAPHSREGV